MRSCIGKAICGIHFPKKFVSFLNKQGIETIHRSDILDSWYPDDKIFVNAQMKTINVFITKDNKFLAPKYTNTITENYYHYF